MQNKPFLSFILFLFLASSAYASHFSMGYLTYKHVGGQNGIATGTYVVELALIRKLNPVAFPLNNVGLRITSECGQSDRSAFLAYIAPDSINQHPNDQFGHKLNMANNCAASIAPDWSLYYYRDTVFINYQCFGIKFIPHLTCCRDLRDNFADQSGRALGLTASLNNTVGPVSLPTPDIERLIGSFCVNQEVSMFGFEPDTSAEDWIFTKSLPLEYSYPYSLTPIPLDTNFTKEVPLPVDTAVGYNLDSVTGELFFKPTQIGYYALALLYRQYDSINGNRALVGAMHFESAAWIGASCDTSVVNGPQLSFENGDTSLIDTCGKTRLILELSQPVQTASVDTAGSELLITSNQGDTAGIKEVNVINPQMLEVLFTDSLYNGNYTLNLRAGADSNIFKNGCGFSTQMQQQLNFTVQGCSNVGVEEWNNHIVVYPVPTLGMINLKNQTGFPITKLTLFTQAGQKLYVWHDVQNAINLQRFESGSYLLHIELASGENKVFRVMKY